MPEWLVLTAICRPDRVVGEPYDCNAPLLRCVTMSMTFRLLLGAAAFLLSSAQFRAAEQIGRPTLALPDVSASSTMPANVDENLFDRTADAIDLEVLNNVTAFNLFRILGEKDLEKSIRSVREN